METTEADKWKTPHWVSGSVEVLFKLMLLLVSCRKKKKEGLCGAFRATSIVHQVLNIKI